MGSRNLLPLLLVLALHGGSRAEAFNLYSVFDGFYNATCQTINLNVAGVPIQIPPIASILDLKSFCRTYQVLRSLTDGEAFLRQITQAGIKGLIRGPLDGFLNGVRNGLASNSAYQEFVAGFDQFMNALADGALKLYNLPHNLADYIYESAFGIAYRLGFQATKDEIDRFNDQPDLTPLEEATRRTPMTDPEAAQTYQYPSAADEAKISTEGQNIVRNLKELGTEVAKFEGQTAAMAEQKEQAQKAAEEARESANRTAVQQSLEAAAEKVQGLAEAASQVTMPQNPITGEKGVAQRFVDDARNAPSDRRLLELQVEAIAALMEQEAIYTSRTAELLTQLAKTQVIATMQIAEEVRRAREAAETERARLSPKAVLEYYEARLREPDPRLEAMKSMVESVCAFYNGARECP